MKVYRFKPTAENEGVRLDQFLATKIPDLSRGRIRKYIDVGGVHIGGRRVRTCSIHLKEGVEVELYIDGLSVETFSLTDSHIVYRDKYLLALNKPSGIETQPTPARYKGTIYDALLRFLANPYRPFDRPSLGMVQRLDRDTSGIMVFSCHPSSHRSLTEIFSGREVEKTYLALVQGRMAEKEGEFRSLLAKNRATNRIRSVNKGGKDAVTRYKVLEEFADASLVEVLILTGRSHQIRVHFSEAGHPLLGDVRYGGAAFFAGENVPRQMLHSWKLRFIHPRTREELLLEASMPVDMKALVETLKR